MPSRSELAKIAEREGALQLQGDDSMAGDAIEKYLAVFREAMNANAGNDQYNDLRIGYPWCCAFAYYCCLQAGYRFPPKPVKTFRWTLAAVATWHHWATQEANSVYFEREAIPNGPQPGDLVIFDHLMSDSEFDHIGIVTKTGEDHLVSAEGGYFNRSGLFERKLDRACPRFLNFSVDWMAVGLTNGQIRGFGEAVIVD